jgi:hypothetical protein
VVEAARANGVGLIPVLFWAHFTWPDLAHEPCNRLGIPNSLTRQMMRTYATEVVTRYASSPTIWAWELGNEFNDWIDIAQFGPSPPPVVPSLGTPTSRTSQDDIYFADLQSYLTDLAGLVHTLDPDRPIISGHNIPRSYGESLRLQENPLTLDTREDYQANFGFTHPGECNTVSMHLYPEFATEQRFDSGTSSSYAELLDLDKQEAVVLDKPLAVLEFGANDQLHGGASGAQAAFEAQLQAFMDSGADLGAARG